MSCCLGGDGVWGEGGSCRSLFWERFARRLLRQDFYANGSFGRGVSPCSVLEVACDEGSLSRIFVFNSYVDKRWFERCNRPYMLAPCDPQVCA